MDKLKKIRMAILKLLVRIARARIGNKRRLRDYVSIFIAWSVCACVGATLYFLVFIMQGVGWISGLFGFLLMSLMTSSVGAVLYYRLAVWEDLESRYSNASLWAALAVLSFGYFLMCAVAPQDQITFMMLLVFQIMSLPTILGPFVMPAMLGEFAPGNDSAVCILFYPAFACAFIVQRWCENKSYRIFCEEQKRREEEYERLRQENQRRYEETLYRILNEKSNSQRH